MKALKSRDLLAKNHEAIATRVRELRRSRGWTQAELSQQLQMSQNRLSEIERGDGSFTAEQFLLLLKLFNVTANHFASEPSEQGLRIQNALARLGANHLQESVQILPSEQLEELQDVAREALADGSPRVVTALAPVLVRNAERLNLPWLFVALERAGLERRLGWVVENTLAALARLSPGSGTQSKEWAKIDQRAKMHLDHFLDYVHEQNRPLGQHAPPDVLDATIRSKKTLEEVRSSISEISRRWEIITGLQVEDFLQALKAARAHH